MDCFLLLKPFSEWYCNSGQFRQIVCWSSSPSWCQHIPRERIFQDLLIILYFIFHNKYQCRLQYRFLCHTHWLQHMAVAKSESEHQSHSCDKQIWQREVKRIGSENGQNVGLRGQDSGTHFGMCPVGWFHSFQPQHSQCWKQGANSEWHSVLKVFMKRSTWATRPTWWNMQNYCEYYLPLLFSYWCNCTRGFILSKFCFW